MAPIGLSETGYKMLNSFNFHRLQGKPIYHLRACGGEAMQKDCASGLKGNAKSWCCKGAENFLIQDPYVVSTKLLSIGQSWLGSTTFCPPPKPHWTMLFLCFIGWRSLSRRAGAEAVAPPCTERMLLWLHSKKLQLWRFAFSPSGTAPVMCKEQVNYKKNPTLSQWFTLFLDFSWNLSKLLRTVQWDSW